MWHGYDGLTILIVVSVQVRRSLMLLLVLLRRYHALATIVVGTSVHVRVEEIGASIFVIRINSCAKATPSIVLMLALERLAVVEVCARRIELLRWLKVLRRK